MRSNGDTKAAMAEALYLCMQTMPIDRISIKTITDMCGLNRQTFYYHFTDIYDLVKWMYVSHINRTFDRAFQANPPEEALREVISAIDGEREYYQAIFESRRYYPRVRREIVSSLMERFGQVFSAKFDELGFDEGYRRFLVEMYALVLFEFIERRTRGDAVSTADSFADNWMHMLRAQFSGERDSGSNGNAL